MIDNPVFQAWCAAEVQRVQSFLDASKRYDSIPIWRFRRRALALAEMREALGAWQVNV